MRCPYCTSQDLRVIDSRDVEDGVRRRRECASCGERFTTYERPQIAGLLVVKKDGRREEFSRDKLLLGIRKACEKRPLAAGTLEAIVDSIETTLNEQGLAEASSQEIGETVMGYLRQMDKIAYIRFASVYRQFEDLDTLREEVDALEGAAAGVVGDKQPPLIPQEELEVLARTPGWRALHERRGTKARFRQRGAASAAAGGAKGSASPPAQRGGPE